LLFSESKPVGNSILAGFSYSRNTLLPQKGEGGLQRSEQVGRGLRTAMPTREQSTVHQTNTPKPEP